MAIKTAIADLLFFVGDDWPAIPFAKIDADEVAAAITGTLSFILYSDKECTTAVFTRTSTDSQITITSAGGGTGYVNVIPDSLTTDLEGQEDTFHYRLYYWRLRETTSGVARTIGFGTIPVRW